MIVIQDRRGRIAELARRGARSPRRRRAWPFSGLASVSRFPGAARRAPGLAWPAPVPGCGDGRPGVLPATPAKPGWLRVRPAQGPSQSPAWVPASDVRLSSTPYRIVITLSTMRLVLYDHGRLVFSAPAG